METKFLDTFTSPPAFSLHHVYKRYKDNLWTRPTIALNDLCLEVEPNEIVGLLGPNGCGKTTLLKLLLGLLKPDSGSIKCFGQSITSTTRKMYGYMPDQPAYHLYLTGEETLRFYGVLKGIPQHQLSKRVKEALSLFSLNKVANKPLQTYSKGMLQRINIAQAALYSPEILLLDEPMSGLDLTGRDKLYQLIEHYKREGKTVIFSSHTPSDMEILCTQVILIRDGSCKGVIDLNQENYPRVNNWEIVCDRGNDSRSLNDILTMLPGNADIESLIKTDGRISLITKCWHTARDIVDKAEKLGHTLYSFAPHLETPGDRIRQFMLEPDE